MAERRHGALDYARLDRLEESLDHMSRTIEAIASVQKHIDNRSSIRKNGDSWKEYIGKFFTIDRILLTVVIIFQFGGTVRNYTAQVEGLVKREIEVTKQNASLTEQLQEARAIQEQQGAVVNDLMAETSRLSQVSGQLNDRIQRTATRSELNEAVQLRIIPRLERIEQTLKVP